MDWHRQTSLLSLILSTHWASAPPGRRQNGVYNTDGEGLEQDSSQVLEQVLDAAELRMPRYPGSPLTPALAVGSLPKHPFGHFYNNRSTRKRKKLPTHEVTWMKLKNITPGKRSQTSKSIHYIQIPSLWNSTTGKTNSWWKKSGEWLPQGGGLTGKRKRNFLRWWKYSKSWQRCRLQGWRIQHNPCNLTLKFSHCL